MYDYDRTVRRIKTGHLMTPSGGEQWEWPRVDNRWDEHTVDRDALGDVHAMQYIAYGEAGQPTVTIDTKPWFIDNRPEFKFTIEVYDAEVDSGKFKPDAYQREIPKVLERALKLAKRDSAGKAKKLEALKVPNWGIEYDEGSDELVVEYKAPGRRDYSDSSMSGTFYAPLKIFSGGKADYDISYSEGADYEGAIGDRTLSGQVKSLNDVKKALKDAEALWEKAEGGR